MAAPGEQRSEGWVEGRRLVCMRSRGIVSSFVAGTYDATEETACA